MAVPCTRTESPNSCIKGVSLAVKREWYLQDKILGPSPSPSSPLSLSLSLHSSPSLPLLSRFFSFVLHLAQRKVFWGLNQPCHDLVKMCRGAEEVTQWK